jgi:hypothetical protein
MQVCRYGVDECIASDTELANPSLEAVRARSRALLVE